jgi:predicted nucleotidyltransferase
MSETAHSQVSLDNLRQRRSEILEVARRHGVTAMWVFGSVVRGENNADSDIDFLVDVEDGTSLIDLGELYGTLTDMLGRPVDLGTRRSLKPRIRERVLREAVPL